MSDSGSLDARRVDGLWEFVEATESGNMDIVVVNMEASEPFQRMLEDLFGEQDIGVATLELADADTTDQVVLTEDDEVLATSPLSELSESILLVNADIYTTGVRSLDDADLPDVLAELDGTRLEMRGYPDTSKGKLLLIAISRYIEARARERGAGRLHTSFQHLSRIDDEAGTREVYRQLADTDTDVHIYGRAGDPDIDDLKLTTHTEDCEELARAWFVVYTDPANDRDAALVTLEVGDNEWDGFWTYDSERVAAIASYIEGRYLE